MKKVKFRDTFKTELSENLNHFWALSLGTIFAILITVIMNKEKFVETVLIILINFLCLLVIVFIIILVKADDLYNLIKNFEE